MFLWGPILIAYTINNAYSERGKTNFHVIHVIANTFSCLDFFFILNTCVHVQRTSVIMNVI